jgi:hypothetical protein
VPAGLLEETNQIPSLSRMLLNLFSCAVRPLYLFAVGKSRAAAPYTSSAIRTIDGATIKTAKTIK